MKLGIFDSGLGGVLMTKALHQRFPHIDMFYYGDTLHMPYGNRSEDAIYEYTHSAMEYMFSQDCVLIILACNTASATALRRLQQEYLPRHYPDRNILGVVVPTLETALELGHKKIGMIGTNYTVRSGVYEQELGKLNPDIKLYAKETPLLVPLIEHNGEKWVKDVLKDYLKPLTEKGIESLMLGCTHYSFLEKEIRELLGPEICLVCQDEMIPDKLEDYLGRHPEYSEKISQGGHCDFVVSDLTENYIQAAHRIYGRDIVINKKEG